MTDKVTPRPIFVATIGEQAPASLVGALSTHYRILTPFTEAWNLNDVVITGANVPDNITERLPWPSSVEAGRNLCLSKPKSAAEWEMKSIFLMRFCGVLIYEMTPEMMATMDFGILLATASFLRVPTVGVFAVDGDRAVLPSSLLALTDVTVRSHPRDRLLSTLEELL